RGLRRRVSRTGLRAVSLLGIVGVWPGVRRLRKHSLPRRNHRLRLGPAINQAFGLSRRWRKAGAPRCLLAHAERYQRPRSSFAQRSEAWQGIARFLFAFWRVTGKKARHPLFFVSLWRAPDSGFSS